MKYANNRILIIIALTIVLLGCFDTRGDFVTTISGKVVDSLTNDPVFNAQIYLGDLSDSIFIMNTNTKGEYIFSDFGYGPFTLNFVKENYRSKSIIVRGLDIKLTFDNVNVELVPEISR